MKQIINVTKFELSNYFRSKGYIMATVLLAILLGVGLCIPTIIDAFDSGESTQEQTAGEEEELDTLVVYDSKGVLQDTSYLTTNYAMYQWKFVDSEEKVKSMVQEEKAKGGFLVTSDTSFSYVVFNRGITDSNSEMFQEILEHYHYYNILNEKGLSNNEIDDLTNTKIQSDMVVLGKDSEQNYWYTYILLFVIYFMIIMYGQMIATSVTSEKSNRAIEVLVTSTNSNSLIFGKVIAGTIASVFQVGLVLGVGLISYQFNREAWDGMLDIVFNIPTNVLVTYGIFGIFGFIFYCFLYAAFGALVSKTEDIGKSIGPITTFVLIGFFVSMYGLAETDSMLVKVCSYIPFTSCYTMLNRVAMGTVEFYEIMISFVILLVSTIGAGILGAKIYRMGTLHYGNPIKFSTIMKRLKNK